MAFDGTNIWATNSNGNPVTKLKASDGSFVGTYNVGINPIGVAFDGANIWVANGGINNQLTKLRASDGSLVGTYTVGLAPQGVAFDGANVWVANLGGNNVTVLNASGARLGTYTGGTTRVACLRRRQHLGDEL